MDATSLRNATASCVTHGRNLFFRFVFLIGMDPSLAIQIIAFWLFIEGNGEANLLQRINSFHGDQFLAIAAMAERVIDMLHGKAPGSSVPNTVFRKQIVFGILSCLNNVCYEVLKDLRQKAEQEIAAGHVVKELSHTPNSHLLRQYNDDWRQNCQAESSNSRSMPRTPIQQIQDLDVRSPQHQRNSGVSINLESTVNYLASELSRCSISPQYQLEPSFSKNSTVMNVDPYFHSRRQFSIVPPDERTLFVTFSLGMPLTEEEVYDFFMRHFGDVESVSVEEPVEVRPSQYALVTFGSRDTMLSVLDGKDRVKFMSGYKHLWARKYERKQPGK